MRFGLTAVKNVGEGAILSMLGVRKEQRPHRFAVPALRGGRPAPRQQAGAREPRQGRAPSTRWPHGRDPLRPARALFAAVDKAIEHGSRIQRNRDRGRVVVLRSVDDDGQAPEAIPLPDAPAWTEAQQLAGEKEALGLYMSGHPLDRFAEELKTFGARRVAELDRVVAGPLGRRHRRRASAR